MQREVRHWTGATPDEIVPIATEQYKAFSLTETKCEIIVDELIKQGAAVALDDKRWALLNRMHVQLFNRHDDMVRLAWGPDAPASVRENVGREQTVQRLRHRILSYLSLQRQHLPASRESLSGFLRSIYPCLTEMSEYSQTVAPESISLWLGFLSDVCRYKMESACGDDEERAVWKANMDSWFMKMRAK